MVDKITPPLNIIANEINEKYGAVFKDLIEGIQIIDFDHRYLYVDDAAIKQNKFSREELIGHTQMEMYPGIENTKVFATIHECLQKRLPQDIENEFKFPDGSSGWYEVRSEPIYYGVLILSIDITDRKRADEIIQKQTLQANLAIARADEAEKMNKAVVDRELKMITLKERVKELEDIIKTLQKN